MSGLAIVVEIEDVVGPPQVLRLGIHPWGGCLPGPDRWLGDVRGNVVVKKARSQGSRRAMIQFDLTGVETFRGGVKQGTDVTAVRGSCLVDWPLQPRPNSGPEQVSPVVVADFESTGSR